MRRLAVSDFSVQELLRHLQLASQLDRADPIADWQRMINGRVTHAVTFLDCPYCCQSRSIHVFSDGECLCEGCPEGWDRHDLLDLLSHVGVPILGRHQVTPGVPADWIRWRDMGVLNSARLFARGAYREELPPYGRGRLVG